MPELRLALRRLVLVALLALVLGASRPLAWKLAKGSLQAPQDVSSAGPPMLVLGENPDNQGYLARKRIDAVALLRLSSAGPAVDVDPGRARFLVAGEPALGRIDAESPTTLRPGRAALIRARVAGILPMDEWSKVEVVEVRIPSSRGEIRAEFSGLRTLPERVGGNYPGAPEADIP